MHWFKQFNRIWLAGEAIPQFSSQPEQLDLLFILGMYLGYCSTQDAAGAIAATTAAVV